MSHRRFLNLVVENCKTGVYSLRRLDLSRQHLFFQTTPPKADGITKLKNLILEEMESIRLPAPSVRFLPNPNPASIDLTWKVHCFGLSESKIICSDNSGLSFLYDASLRAFVTMPNLYAPKRVPISFAVHDDPRQAKDGCGSSLYVMEKVLYPHYPEKGLFEAFVLTTSDKTWHRHSLPPPPFVLDPGYEGAQIHTYAILGGGSHLCISTRDIGTYCFNTASREWSRAGDWTLPFYGKVEYIPELNLWFGLSERDLHPCTSDLSSVLRGRKPMLSNIWRNLYPPEWNSLGTTKLANLGSGRFCILKYFETLLDHTNYYGEPLADQTFVVCTGVELLASRGHGDNGNGIQSCSSNGKGKRVTQMINHMSKLIEMPAGYTKISAFY